MHREFMFRSSADASSSSAGSRILLVEDHADTRVLLARLLRSRGHEVHTADSVAAALQAAQKHPLDLLISDLSLPDGSGLDLMRQLKDTHLKGISVSGHGAAEDIREARDAGFVSHLTKPISLHQLETAIRDTLQ